MLTVLCLRCAGRQTALMQEASSWSRSTSPLTTLSSRQRWVADRCAHLLDSNRPCLYLTGGIPTLAGQLQHEGLPPEQ